MHSKLFVASGFAAAVSLVVFVVGAGAQTSTLTASLSGEKEVSAEGEMGVGDPNGRGNATARINVDRNRVCFTLNWRGIEAPSMAHIHEGTADEAGPVVVTLFMTGDEAAEGDQDLPANLRGVTGCTPDVETALLRNIRNNPRNYYVNVHNDEYPAGAIRGQLHR